MSGPERLFRHLLFPPVTSWRHAGPHRVRVRSVLRRCESETAHCARAHAPSPLFHPQRIR
jgi:hypothetical protein